MLHHQSVSDHHPKSVRRRLLKAKRANSGKKADANLKDAACRAVAAGLPVSEVATATGYCTARGFGSNRTKNRDRRIMYC